MVAAVGAGAGDVVLACCGCVVVVVAVGDAVGFVVGWCVLGWVGCAVCVLVEVGGWVGVVGAGAQVADAMLMVAASVPWPAAMWTRMPITVVDPSLLVTCTS